MVIRIGEGPTAADRHETRVAVFRENHTQQAFSALRNVMVGRARFELAVSWSQTRRFTELSHRPRAAYSNFAAPSPVVSRRRRSTGLDHLATRFGFQLPRRAPAS